MSYLLKIFSLGMLVGFYMPLPVWADTLPVSEDTFINLNKPNQKNGNDKQLEIRNTGGGDRQTFFKFDLSGTEVAETVDQVLLRFWIDKVKEPGALSVHEVLEDWDESTLTAETVPAFSPAISTVLVTEADEKRFFTIDVTTTVQGWLDNPDNNLGLALLGDPADDLQIQVDSKENSGTSHHAELEVVVVNVGPEGPQGLQGDVGPQGVQGIQGIPGNLVLAGQLCPFGEVLTGFDEQGNIVCASFFPPALGAINGPFNDVVQGFIDQFCGLTNPPDPTCVDQFAVFDQLTRYEISGQAQPDAAISIFLSPTCDAGTEWDDIDGPLGQFMTDQLGQNAALVLTPGFIDTVFGTSNEVQSNGTYTSTLLVVDQPPALISIQSSLGGSSCSNALAVP